MQALALALQRRGVPSLPCLTDVLRNCSSWEEGVEVRRWAVEVVPLHRRLWAVVGRDKEIPVALQQVTWGPLEESLLRDLQGDNNRQKSMEDFLQRNLAKILKR